VLATAVVIGASRSAARREVSNQTQQQQYDQMSSEQQKRDDEEREKRTQAAIDEAIAKERLRNEQIQAGASRVDAKDADTPPKYSGAPVDVKAVRYCRKCGRGCESSDKFCTQCGCKVEETA
jgi:rubrerythrin